jgi:hypothetical protein
MKKLLFILCFIGCQPGPKPDCTFYSTPAMILEFQDSTNNVFLPDSVYMVVAHTDTFMISSYLRTCERIEITPTLMYDCYGAGNCTYEIGIHDSGFTRKSYEVYVGMSTSKDCPDLPGTVHLKIRPTTDSLIIVYKRPQPFDCQ